MSLRAWFPPPSTPVRLAGRVVLASQLRLSDLAMLESFVVARLGGPLDALDPADPRYPDDLRAAYDEVDRGEWPPPPSSADWRQIILGDPTGLELLLAVVLREMPGVDIPALMESMTPADLDAVEDVAWGLEPDARELIVRAVDRHLGLPDFPARARGPEGPPVTWAKAIADLIVGTPDMPAPSWASPREIGELTISQYRMICRAGQDTAEEDPLPEDEALCKVVEDARYAFFFPDGHEEEGDEDEGPGLVEGPELGD